MQNQLIQVIDHMEWHAINFNYKFMMMLIMLIYLSLNMHIMEMLI